jgi:hypothetical protein
VSKKSTVAASTTPAPGGDADAVYGQPWSPPRTVRRNFGGSAIA